MFFFLEKFLPEIQRENKTCYFICLKNCIIQFTVFNLNMIFFSFFRFQNKKPKILELQNKKKYIFERPNKKNI
jgi:hypothetical protein